MRRLTSLLLLAVAACADTGTGPDGSPNFARIKEAEDSHGGTPFMVALVPNSPVGDPNPAASGLTLITLNSGQEEICFKMSFSGLSAPVTGAFINDATGTSVVTLSDPAIVGATSGGVAKCVFAPRELIKTIRKNPANFSIVLPTGSVPENPLIDRPGGALSGQIQKTQGSTVNHG